MAKFAILAILWAVTLWRARAAFRNPATRPMWTAFAALALSLTVELPQVGPHVDATLHVTNISTLIKQLAGMLAAASVLERVISSTQPTRALGPALAWRHVMTGAAMAALSVLFAFVPHIETSNFIDTAPGHPVTIAYEAVWLGYLGLAMLCAAAMFATAWGRSAGKGQVMRTSFALLTIGTGLGVIYAAWRVVVLAASLSGAASPQVSQAGFRFSNLIQDAAIVLILTGTCVPALLKVATLHQDRRDLIALRPLWERVIVIRPDTMLDEQPDRDASLRPRDLRLIRFRLIRRTVEIRDALATLYEYCDLDPAPYAEAFATAIGLSGTDRDALIEAVTIHYALLNSRVGTPEHSIVQAGRGGADLRSEVEWMRAISRALENHIRMQSAVIPVLAARNDLLGTA
jgi:hypothetical protein